LYITDSRLVGGCKIMSFRMCHADVKTLICRNKIVKIIYIYLIYIYSYNSSWGVEYFDYCLGSKILFFVGIRQIGGEW
jgi:hypothetical protein